MRDHCKACDVVRTTLEVEIDDELCLECLKVSLQAAQDWEQEDEK